MSIISLSYPNNSLLRSVTVQYDNVAHTVLSASVGTVPLTFGISPGTNFYTQTGVGESWSVRAQNTYPYAYVVHITLTLPSDLLITSVAVVNQTPSVLGSITVSASGTGTKRYQLGSGTPQASNVFSGLTASGAYILTLSRTEDGYTVTQNVVVLYVSGLEVITSKTNCSANLIADGTLTITVLNGSGDYYVNFVTEAVFANLTAANNTITRAGLVPDIYVVDVLDNILGTTQTFQIEIVYPAIVAEVIAGTVFNFPIANSITFVVTDNELQNLDNTLFEDEEHLGYETDTFNQLFNFTDIPRIQFKSNYNNHTLNLYKKSDDALIKNLPIQLTEQNVGTTIDLQIIIKDYTTPNQSRVHFQTGTIPIPLIAGNIFEITNNGDGFDGLYSILSISVDVDGISFMVINLDYTAGGATSIGTGTFDNQLANYNVYEANVDFSEVDAGCYYLKVAASSPASIEATSEPIHLKDSHKGTFELVYTNTDNDFGSIWSTGFRGFLRIRASMFKRITGGERTVTRSSNDSLIKVKARKRRLIDFETDMLPPYMHEKLSVIFDTDYFSINGIAYQASDSYDEPQYQEHSRLSLSKIRLEQLNWFGTFKSNKDMVSEAESCVCDTIDLVAVPSSAATITLDMNNKIQRIFKVTGTIGVIKTFALTLDSLALSFKLIFELTALVNITFPSNFKSRNSDPRWNDSTKIFTPNDLGVYDCEVTYDGTNWRLLIYN